MVISVGHGRPDSEEFDGCSTARISSRWLTPGPQGISVKTAPYLAELTYSCGLLGMRKAPLEEDAAAENTPDEVFGSDNYGPPRHEKSREKDWY
jgi:hypothetical protein